MDLLDYYRDNLRYLRGLSAEFAADFPKIARRLLLSEFDCQDPYIERLLEGTAFLSAKVEKKLDEGYYPFLESVLNSVAPGSLYPVPSGAILEMTVNTADEKIKRGISLKAGTVFETVIPGINTPCRFSSAEDTPLSPFVLKQAEYVNHISVLGIKNPDAESALHIQFSSPGGEVLHLTNDIRIFLGLSEVDVSRLLRLLSHDIAGVYMKGADGTFKALSGVSCTVPMPAGEQFFGAQVKTNVRGLRLLKNFLTYPSFFNFFSICGLESSVGTAATSADLVIAFKRRVQELVTSVKTSSVKLNCVPVLNVFSRRSDRVTIERTAGVENYEFQIIPDRTAMRDYEVVAVKNIDFYNERNDFIFSAVHFYDDTITAEKKKRDFFSVKRRKKPVEQRSSARSTYNGRDVFVSFSVLREDAYQFAADLLVTNRDLPLLLRAGAEFSSPSPLVQRAVFATLPTRPDYSLVERGDTDDFSRLSHIVMNLSALLWQEGSRPLELFKNMLRSYPIRPAEEMERMIGGISALQSKSSVFQCFMNGTVFYEWGWKVQFTLDENAYVGMGFYLFARVMGEILISFTPINTFLEIQCNTLQSGTIALWKTSKIQ